LIGGKRVWQSDTSTILPRDPPGLPATRRRRGAQTWRHVADPAETRWPKLAALMDDSEHDVLAYTTFPAQHRTKLHSTNPLEG
jgi:transposase-like protein